MLTRPVENRCYHCGKPLANKEFYYGAWCDECESRVCDDRWNNLIGLNIAEDFLRNIGEIP